MSIKITDIRLSDGGTGHEHITDLKWIGYEDGASGAITRRALVTWINDGKGKAYIEAASVRTPVFVATPAGAAPFVRTFAKGEWTDTLLTLPRF